MKIISLNKKCIFHVLDCIDYPKVSHCHCQLLSLGSCSYPARSWRNWNGFRNCRKASPNIGFL